MSNVLSRFKRVGIMRSLLLRAGGEEGPEASSLADLNAEAVSLAAQHQTPLTTLLKTKVASLIKFAVRSREAAAASAAAVPAKQDEEEHYSSDGDDHETGGDDSVENWPAAPLEEGRARVAPPGDSDDSGEDAILSDVEE
jgi:hypothetical protein